jgi:hypothetical protein
MSVRLEAEMTIFVSVVKVQGSEVQRFLLKINGIRLQAQGFGSQSISLDA